MEYPDASVSFIADLAREYSIKIISPSDLSNLKEPEKIIKNAQRSFGNLDGLVLNHAYSTNSTICDRCQYECELNL
jgi:3-oxoacyl-[acyl-carrier protein] reductase